jgi:hypothetical protein
MFSGGTQDASPLESWEEKKAVAVGGSRLKRPFLRNGDGKTLNEPSTKTKMQASILDTPLACKIIQYYMPDGI